MDDVLYEIWPAWRRQQQLVIWSAVVVLGAVCVLEYVGRGYYVAQPAISDDFSSLALYDKVNPNTASWVSLVRLGGLGPTRARNIVAYRETFGRAHGSAAAAFTCADDLQRVKNIGPVTAAAVAEFLVFDGP